MKKISKKAGYIFLAASIVFEQIGTSLLGATECFTRILPTVGLIIAYFISYLLFSKLLQIINLSIAYATWTALGTVSAAVAGFFLYNQVISVAGWIFMIIMIIGIFILNFSGSTDDCKDSKGDITL